MKQRFTLALIGLVGIKSAMAVPTIYPTEVSHLSSIINPTNSNLVSDTMDKHKFFVMPPNTGKSEVSNLHSLSANLGFCREMSDLQTYSRETVEGLQRLREKENEKMDEIDLKVEAITAARKDLAKYAHENNLEEITYIDERVDVIEARITELSDQMQTCRQGCRDLRQQIKVLQAEKREELKRRRTITSENRTAARKYKQKENVVSALEKELELMEEQLDKMKDRLVRMRTTFLNMYSSFSKLEGAKATISFSNKWEKNLNELRENNPGYSFQKIQTQNAVITSALAGIESLPTTGAVLSYRMGGNFSEGALKLPAYPEESSGLVTLSLVGACPMLHPDYFDVNLPNGTGQMSYGLTVSYEYPSAFKVEATAKYNMYKMYQKIVKSKKRGGFFSSRRTTSVEEKTYFRDSFKVEWKEQDSANSLTSEEKLELEREWRHAIFGRLAAVGLPAAASAGTLELPTPPQTGAVVLGNALQRNRACQSNVYCMGATIGVKVLSAVFGSSKATNSYTNIQDAELTEEWSREKVIYKPWISTYK